MTLIWVVDAEPHLDSDNVSVEPCRRVRRGGARRDGPSPLGSCCCSCCCCYDLVGMIFFVSCSFSCLVVLVLVVIAVIYGQTIIASIQFCESSYFKRLHFCTLVSASYPVLQNPTQPPVFYCPPQSKNVVFIPKITLFTDFLPVFRP